MKTEDCKLNIRVCRVAKIPPFSKGEVISPPVNNTVVVEWGNGNFERVRIHDLVLEAEGIVLEKKLLEEKSRLEREFNEVQEQCSDKLQKAADLIQEAARLARTKNIVLVDILGSRDAIECALDAGGWSTSSWHC